MSIEGLVILGVLVFFEGAWRVDNSWNEECPVCGSMKYVVEPYAEGVAGRCHNCGYETTE